MRPTLKSSFRGGDDGSSSVVSEQALSESSFTSRHTRGSSRNGDWDKALSADAKRMTSFVNYTKTLVFLTLLLSVLAVGAATFLFARSEEEDTFREFSDRYATNIVKLVQLRSTTLLQSSAELAHEMKLDRVDDTLDPEQLAHYLAKTQALQFTWANKNGENASWTVRQQVPLQIHSSSNLNNASSSSSLWNDPPVRAGLDYLEQEQSSVVLSPPFFSNSSGEPPQPHMYLMQAEQQQLLLTAISWQTYLSGLLLDKRGNMTVVVQNDCSADVDQPSSFSYQVIGTRRALYLGTGDRHDTKYNNLEMTSSFLGGNNDDYCRYQLRIYPSEKVEEDHISERPAQYTMMVIVIFMLAAIGFAFYDYVAEIRHERVLGTAHRTNQIISSFFPDNVRDRILQDAEQQAHTDVTAAAEEMKGFLNAAPTEEAMKRYMEEQVLPASCSHTPATSSAIADFYPAVSILFADIPNFTAWSSTRAPQQMFILLECLFAAFDECARQRRVFKVETVGDCYVAAAGVPDPHEQHAVILVKFARHMLTRMQAITKQLEASLGPDTGDLQLRVGIHSGQITAGVLRGEKTRFQLFGDTMNTASRMQSTGTAGKIQVSEDTAKLLQSVGKSTWLEEREDKVYAKGKGHLETYWITPEPQMSQKRNSLAHGGRRNKFNPFGGQSMRFLDNKAEIRRRRLEEKRSRLVTWNSELMMGTLRRIASQRPLTRTDDAATEKALLRLETKESNDAQVIESVTEVLPLPVVGEYEPLQYQDLDRTDLSSVVKDQVRNYVETIAELYRDNPFHNFEHASHVSMSITKMLARISTSEVGRDAAHGDASSESAGMAFGLNADPMTLFACIFATLIHDVDHSGVPNAQLVQESAIVAKAYSNRSVAEQNSFDVAWRLLMDDSYRDFRRAIYNTVEGYQNFRQMVINLTMATDLMDPELKAWRDERWNASFLAQHRLVEVLSPVDTIRSKATLVVEYIIQASDISHTIQHWSIYTKWNQMLFVEMYLAFQQGRAARDPAEFWYEGEIAFFDQTVIPLANKLRASGIFGQAGDEFLDYAQSNRQAWVSKGESMVQQYADYAKSELPVLRDKSTRSLLQPECSPRRPSAK